MTTKRAWDQWQTTQKLQNQSGLVDEGYRPPKNGKTRVMYIECKSGDLVGDARIGKVTFSKTGKTLYYSGMKFQSLKGAGFKSNYFEVDTGCDYWISGPKKDGSDRLYGERVPILIDEDVREEYWCDIRSLPESKNETQYV